MLRKLAVVASVLALAACGGSKDFSRGETTRRTNVVDTIDTRPSGEEAAKINIQLGQAYLSQGKLDMAMEKLKKAIELAPRNSDGHTVIAVLYEQLGNLALAGEHYQEARKLAPESGLTANNLGRFLCTQGQFNKADALFTAALSDPFYRTPETALLNRGSCALTSGKREIASESLRLALEHNPDMPEALYLSATLAMKSQDALRARAFIERYLAATAASPKALAFAIEIETALGDRRAVKRYRDRLVQEFPESAEAESLQRNLGSR